MSHKLTVAVPRLASTVLLLAQNPHRINLHSGPSSSGSENDIDVLMVKRHGKARFMPSVYVFPGGGVDVADCVAAQDILAREYDVRTERTAEAETKAAGTPPPPSFMEAQVHPSAAEGEAQAWSCRVGALRELAEEASCVLHGDATMSSMAQWQETTSAAKGAAAAAAAGTGRGGGGAIFDAGATALLRPIGRWVTPRHFQYRYDTYFYAALVRGASPSLSSSSASAGAAAAGAPTLAASPAGATGFLRPAQDVPLIAQASEVAELLWLSPLEALRRHEDVTDVFSLAPPTFLILHALARQQSYAALAERWAAHPPCAPAASPSATASASPSALGRLPYSSVLPCVEPRSRMAGDKKHIEDFMLPEHYLHEQGWSEPAGAYRFCGEAFDGQRHVIRMWVGETWARRVKEGGADHWASEARDLSH